MFVLLFALGAKDNSILQGLFINDEDLKIILQNKEVDEIYLAPKKKRPTRNKRNFRQIFNESPLMGKEQVFSCRKSEKEALVVLVVIVKPFFKSTTFVSR